jgi:Arc/MetJ-type ribon-helix-helix transcriptional regulator
MKSLHVAKTSLSIPYEIKEKIDYFLKKKLIKNQTDFINESLKKNIKSLEEKLKQKESLKSLNALYNLGIKATKSSEKVVREERENRERNLYKGVK